MNWEKERQKKRYVAEENKVWNKRGKRYKPEVTNFWRNIPKGLTAELRLESDLKQFL